jgi:hypothetical protein
MLWWIAGFCIAWAAEPAREVEVGCSWAADGKATRAIPVLEAALRAQPSAADAGRAWGCLALARADLADDPERNDAISQLDSAAFAWQQCSEIAERGPTDPCAPSAARLHAVTLRRAEWLRAGLQAGRRGFERPEAIERCRQARLYAASSFQDEVCLGRLGATLADPALALEGARGVLAAGFDPDQTSAQDAALAAGLDVPVRLVGDADLARQLANEMAAHLDGQRFATLPETQRALSNLDTFTARLLPLRTAARTPDSKAHRAWLLALLDVKWVDLAVREAALTDLALPSDIATAELTGIVRVNALAGGATDRANTLAAARAALERCLKLDPAHPRCGTHLARLPAEPSP